MTGTRPKWEYMRDFAIKMVEHAIKHSKDTDNEVFNQRMAILHLDHANELLMKSALMKNGYVVEFLDKNDVSSGMKKTEIEAYEKTLSYPNCLELVSKIINQIDKPTKDRILDFHKLRNEIQHRAINIPLDKKDKITEFYPSLKNLYELMYPDKNDFPAIR